MDRATVVQQAKDAYFGAMGFYYVMTVFTVVILFTTDTPFSTSVLGGTFLLASQVIAYLCLQKTHAVSKSFLRKNKPESLEVAIAIDDQNANAEAMNSDLSF